MSDWWLHFNERVRNRKEGEYGPFTNADWQAACQAEAEIEKLRARNDRMLKIINGEPHRWKCKPFRNDRGLVNAVVIGGIVCKCLKGRIARAALEEK